MPLTTTTLVVYMIILCRQGQNRMSHVDHHSAGNEKASLQYVEEVRASQCTHQLQVALLQTALLRCEEYLV
jgi:hypothetical protein